MKRASILAFVVCAITCAQAANPAVPEMQPLTIRFSAAMEAAAGTQNEKRGKITAEYSSALDAVFKKVAGTGELDAALQVKAEKERVERGDRLSEQTKDAMIPLLRAAHDRYDLAVEPLQLAQKLAENAARRQYVADLDQLQRDLTKRTELEKALAVKAEKERVASQIALTPGAVRPVVGSAPASANPAVDFYMRGFFDKLKAAAANPRILKNSLSKRDRGKPFQDLPKEGALLAGIELTKGDWFGAPLFHSLQPIYLTATGKTRGSVYGLPGRDPVTIEAREGYAVGAMSFLDGNFFWSLEVTFMKVDPLHRNLDRKDSYKSDVYGDLSRHTDKPKTVGGDGTPIIGIFGFADEEMNALGIVQAP